MFHHILLEPEQEELLVQLVEASRSVPREKREPFLIVPWSSESHYQINHPGFPRNLQVYRADLDALRYQRRHTAMTRSTSRPKASPTTES